MIFADNPFLDAAEQFTHAARLRFTRVRSHMIQSTDGSLTVEMVLHPSEPPSEFGYLVCNFRFDLGQFAELRFRRELAEDDEESTIDWLPEEGPTLRIERVYHAPLDSELEMNEVTRRTRAVLAEIELRGEDGCAWVDRYERWATRPLFSMESHSERVEVGIAETYTLAEVHSRDWGLFADETYALLAELAAAATGRGPAAAPQL